MKTINNLLNSLNACSDAKEWAKDLAWQQIFDTCHRGDWLLWLFKRTNPNDLQLLTLAKGHCANTVRHLMKDKRSTDAVDAAIKFGMGEITREELNAAYADAYAAYADAAANAAYAAANAAYAAAYAAADAAAYAAADAADAAADAANAAYADADADARKANQLLTANICRQYLQIDEWNIKFDTK